MYSTQHEHGGHSSRLTVTRARHGWEVREEHDQRIVRISRHSDWHQVERSIQIFELEAREPGMHFTDSR